MNVFPKRLIWRRTEKVFGKGTQYFENDHKEMVADLKNIRGDIPVIHKSSTGKGYAVIAHDGYYSVEARSMSALKRKIKTTRNIFGRKLNY
jgi:hypothetical protein